MDKGASVRYLLDAEGVKRALWVNFESNVTPG
jgi:hypothetical protein